MRKLSIENFRRLIKEVTAEVIREGVGLPAHSVIPIEDFVTSELDEAGDMLGAKHREFPPEEMQSYLGRVHDKEKTRTDIVNMPFVHGSNVEIKDEKGRKFNLEKLKKAISQRPPVILKQNEKITKSGGGATVYFNIGLPAIKGLAVNEKTGKFVIIDTCPGAGACKTFCYAKRGGYVQWKASSMSQTRVLNFLLNDPDGFKTKLEDELLAAVNRYDKGDIDLVVRWHDSGDFFSPDYKNLAYSIARAFPKIRFYAYTKLAAIASGNKPKNFVTNFSTGAKPEQEKKVDVKKTKHSQVVPRQMFMDFIVTKDTQRGRLPEKDKAGKMQWKSPEELNKFKKKMSARYDIPVKSLITYGELMEIPEGDEMKYNVIVKPGDGDDAASRKDVLGTYLLIH